MLSEKNLFLLKMVSKIFLLMPNVFGVSMNILQIKLDSSLKCVSWSIGFTFSSFAFRCVETGFMNREEF